MTTAPTPPTAPPTHSKNRTWEVFKVILPLLFSSLVGAVFVFFVQEWRARIPTIHRSIEASRMFSGAGPKLKASVAVTEGDKTYKFSNLTLATIKIANHSKQDYKSFPFSVVMPTGSEVIQSEVTTKGPSHRVTPHVEPTPDKPLGRLDYDAEPFNRTEGFTVTLYVQSVFSGLRADEIEVDSAESIKWASLGEEEKKPSILSMTSIVFIVFLFVLWVASVSISASNEHEKQKTKKEEIEREKETNTLLAAILKKLQGSNDEGKRGAGET